MEIEVLIDGVDFSETMTRTRFEKINDDLFKNTLGPVKQVMGDSGLKTTQIDESVCSSENRKVSPRCSS